ncbi:MAG: PhaM family polyhydroxyalkanoate granule multifunctional regulatory protein [Burkholderiaceae bacterium]|jgi:hypothetical protein
MQNPSDPFAFMRNQWSGLGSAFQFPNHAMPPTNLEDLDRRISDLKTVEQWLNLNLNMLKTTIQGLEVQRGTLAAVQSFQEAMGQFSHPESAETPSDTPNASRAAADQARQQATAWWESMQGQFNQLVQQAQSMTQATAEAADAAVKAAQQPAKTEAKKAASKSPPASRARRRSTTK